MNRVAIVVPTYGGMNGFGVDRLRFMLETIKRNDPGSLEEHWLIVEDPCGKPEVAEAYDSLGNTFNLPVAHLDKWSNMHGAAKKAFELAFDAFDPEWVIYLGDDLAVTKGALSNLIHFVTKNELKTVSLVQPAYWNAHDFCRTVESEWEGPKLFWTKEKDFYAGMDWTDRVPRNPHWDGEGVARPYVNVNGVGFACKSETFRKVGGFSKISWCLDESIAFNTWTKSDQGIVCLPGPPLVHYFGASGVGHHVQHDAHTEEKWIEEFGLTKHQSGEILYGIMAEREAAIKAEMATCSYYSAGLVS